MDEVSAILLYPQIQPLGYNFSAKHKKKDWSIMDNKTKKKAGTFQLNKKEAIHGWYSYVEGYSSCLVTSELDMLSEENISAIYDPFGGTGTTPLVSVQRGINAYYSESNPFMLGVIDAKINSVKRLVDSGIKTSILHDFRKHITTHTGHATVADPEWDGFEKFYEPAALRDILHIKEEISKITEPDTKALLMLALSSICVQCSKMIRRGDLRYATEKEKKAEDVHVLEIFLSKLDTIILDLETEGASVKFHAEKLSDDARDIDIVNKIDCVITSPPYLNGTNYIRNTKLELKLNDHVVCEDELPAFHSKGIIAGINNVSKRHGSIRVLPIVQPFLDKLAPVVYDRRIVTMVAGYFLDMSAVISKLAQALRDGGVFIMDIGDSQFAGVHIPTHDILCEICAEYGFKKYSETVLRERRSKNGMILSQRVLRFRLTKRDDDSKVFKQKAVQFMQDMPYRKEPYSGRNWGHPWHSLCSYHGKLKPAIAHFLIEYFTQEGDVVLDPLCGVGTIPFEACLQGRVGIGNDLSELAYVVSKAKLEKPSVDSVNNVVSSLSEYISVNSTGQEIENLAAKYANFGFNGKLPNYFHEDTYREILCAREYFVRKLPHISSAEAIVFAAFLHVLHGNRPYALSRNSHPLTPYAPSGEFIYKNLVDHIREKLRNTYNKGIFSNYREGNAIWGDYNDISNLTGKVDAIICSPPFVDSIRFYMQNWMRLWLCGWEPENFKAADEVFLDVKQRKDFSIYTSFFAMCSKVLKHSGKIILHLGKTDKIDMASELSKYAAEWFVEIYQAGENVADIEKHGIKDKGATIEHQFLFLQKK